MNVLIADDHPGVRNRMMDIICEAFPDVHLTHASDGNEVIQHCNTSGCDLLIMDIKMPGHSGIEILRKLRETNSIPVILISTHPADQYSLAAAKAGANAFIEKGSINDELILTLGKLIKQRSELCDDARVVKTITTPR